MFKKPSELWGDDPDMKKADSSKQTYMPFVFPELILSEYVIDPTTKQKKLDANGKPLTQNYNVFERFIDLIVKIPECKAVLKATGFLDLDKIWEKLKIKTKDKNGCVVEIEHPQIKLWREHIPKEKTLNLAQMFPTPYTGRKLYYSFLLFIQDAEWESKETDQLDDKGKKIKKNQKKLRVNENGEPILRLGGFMPNKAPSKGGQVEIYVNTWHFETHNERIKDTDGNEKVIKVEGKEMEYLRTKGYIHDQKVVDHFIALEKMAFQQLSIQPDFDKPYLWILTTGVKPLKNPTQYASHDTTIDAFYLSK
jgi:hypothetical protein